MLTLERRRRMMMMMMMMMMIMMRNDGVDGDDGEMRMSKLLHPMLLLSLLIL